MPTLTYNTCGGAAAYALNSADSAWHGDPWDVVDGFAAYDERPDTGWPALRLGSAVPSAGGVGLSVGTRSSLSVSAYVWVPTGGAMTLYVGGTGSGTPVVEWTADALRLGDARTLTGVENTATRDRFVRIEALAEAGAVTYRMNHVNVDLTAPDLEASGTYSGDLTLARLTVPEGDAGWVHQFRVGEATWLGSAILSRASGTTPEVHGLQLDLLDAGYELPTYGADGEYGQETEDAVIAFQRDQGLLDDGMVGQETRARLDDVLNPVRYGTTDGHSGWGPPLGG